MTTPNLEESIYLDWWGLLRRPPIHLQLAVERRDLIAHGALFGTVLVLGWVLLLFLISPLSGLVGPNTWDSTAIASLLLIIPIAVTLFLPISLVSRLQLHDWILASRDRGYLRRVDSLLILASLIVIVLLFTRLFLPAGWIQPELTTAELAPLLILASGSLMTAILWKVAPALPFIARGRTIVLPDWLNRLLSDEEDGPEMPEEGAAFEYAFPEPERAIGRVGVRVADEVIHRLREINAEHNGCLYQVDGPHGALAVVLGIDSPVNGVGTTELRRLVGQILRVSQATGRTPYQLAEEILRFAQRSIRYVHDDASTRRVLGKEYAEYGRFPLETLLDGEGDCECTSLLCAAILAWAGFPCALFFVSVRANAFEPASKHAAIGLLVEEDQMPLSAEAIGSGCLYYEGKAYLYGETATDDSNPDGFGVIPKAWRDRMDFDQVIEILPPRRSF